MTGPPLHNSGSYMGSFLSQPSSATLKRPRAASAPCESEEARLKKRSRSILGSDLINEKIAEEVEGDNTTETERSPLKSKGKEKESVQAGSLVLGGITAAVIEDLAQELKCGCCTELCYNPVIVNPCQHFFCGSCCILWVRNGGTNCPACRGISTSVTPSRVLQSMIDLLLRSDPSKGRTENERTQADQVYRAGTALRLPTPRPVTPEPNLEPINDNFARPCPTCLPGNAYGWRCPVPIADPAVDQENAFDLDDGTPPGHTFCGNCDQLHNLQAPTSTKCDLCQVSFCGVGIQGRCCALPLQNQQPHAMTELQDVILSGSIYDSFRRNSVEVDILVDYLRTNGISLRRVYREIVDHIQQQPNSFTPLIESGIFDDLHPVSGGDDPDSSAQRRRICRLCAAQVLIYGFKDWWIRERGQGQGHLPDDVLVRKDCPQGSGCDKQTDTAHSKEFNHIIHVPAPASELPAPEHPLNPSLSIGFDPISISSIQSQAEPSDIDMQMPPRLGDILLAEALASSMTHSSSQAEVEAMTNISRHAEGSSNAGSAPAFLFAMHSPPPAEDVVMTGVEEDGAKDGEAAQASMQVEKEEPEEPDGGEEKMERLASKTAAGSSRALAHALSPGV